jgi:hypothetical protein
MEQVRETAAAPPPLPFPWPRFLLGLAMVAVLAGLSARGVASLPIAEALNTAFGRVLTVLQGPGVARALGGSVASSAGTFLLVRLTLMLTGARR